MLDRRMTTRAPLVMSCVALCLGMLGGACQGDRAPASASASGSGSGSGSAGAPAPRPPAGGFGSGVAEDALASDEPMDAAPTDEPEPVDPGAVIEELRAISAWQAVIDRWTLLERRGQRGVVYGQLGPPILVAPPPTADPLDAGPVPVADAALVPSGKRWLIDDTEGTGSLGIRIELGPRFEPLARQGDRVALGGAWRLDADRRWFWAVDRVEPLPPAPPSAYDDPRPPVPGHDVATGPMPAGARAITVAGDNDVVYFQVVGRPPEHEGDGWPIAAELGDPVVALLNLPGERATYGGQDMRAVDERWQLRRGQTYALRIGRIRNRGDDRPARINARTAPVRVR